MKSDREEEERRRENERLSRIKDDQKYLDALQEAIRKEKAKGKGYTQPVEASWREFLQKRGWTPLDVGELPEDFVYSEWGRYTLQVRYGLGI
jgi:hypothetical protein